MLQRAVYSIVLQLVSAAILGLAASDAAMAMPASRQAAVGETEFDHVDSSHGGRPQNQNTLGVIESRYLRSRESAAHCGLYSLFYACCALDHDVPLDRLLSSEYVKDPRGSTARELASAARDFGLYAMVLQNVSINDLRAIRTPCLLLLDVGFEAEGTRHWVAYLGETEGDAVIGDAPYPPHQIAYPELLSAWSGAAILVSEFEFSRGTLILRRLCGFVRFWPMFVCVALALLWPENGLTRRQRFKKSFRNTRSVYRGLYQGGLLVVAASAWMVWDATTQPESLLRNPQTAQGVVCQEHADRSNAAARHAGWDQALSTRGIVIDCRTPEAYDMGHLESAYNLPVDCSPREFREFLERRHPSPNEQIFVYCQSVRCEWDTIAARRLRCHGFENVFVVDGGWEAFQSRPTNGR